MINKPKTYHFFIVLFLSFTFFSCDTTITDSKVYMEYLADESNGLKKTKTTMGLMISFKYLPVDYLAFSEIRSSGVKLTEEEKLNLKKEYENSMTFLLTFAPDEGKDFDVTKVGISNYEDFAVRIEEMNFNMSNYVSMETEGEIYRPELTQMESTYGLEQKRNILIVFNKKEIKDDIRIVYDDQIFGTGIQKFRFHKDDLLAIPQFIF